MTAKKSIYDRWLMTRFTIAFVILTYVPSLLYLVTIGC
jgi:hypothetical protein